MLTIKENITEVNYVEIKNLSVHHITLLKRRKFSQEGEKIFAIHIIDKELILGMSKELLQTNKEKKISKVEK